MSHLQNKKPDPPLTQEFPPEPYLEWHYQFNEKTGETELSELRLSNGNQLDGQSLKKATKMATGTSDFTVGHTILTKTARGLALGTLDERFNEACALLPALAPKDPTDALLLGQFLALNDAGMKCLQMAHTQGQAFYHVEKLFTLANKLLNTANQTMQTVIKYRSGGQQTVQVVHLHNEGQAIVAQNLSSQPPIEGGGKNLEIEPHGSL